jgi:hypothetical protein
VKSVWIFGAAPANGAVAAADCSAAIRMRDVLPHENMFPTHFGSILDEATTPPSGANQARHCAQKSRFGIARQKIDGGFWDRLMTPSMASFEGGCRRAGFRADDL